MAFKFTDENFETEVLKSDIPVLIDFYADWCGPCKMMAPVIEELAGEYEGTVKIGKLNVDEAPGISSQYRVMSIPTLLFVKNGEVVDTVVGAISKNQVVDKLNQIK
ncbi:thioredoxin-2 [Anaerocolumna cellulosilytica]|uniref:Thioredoxin n=1 Tax=Anaerocolumna cellulosilytica TaxID=433286 RepID=A0A6S6R1X9_9FIRM|nr:thioredoxin [Anaerocolumna cellulosilytica]MBB5195913.1 thioredoxin 1 [Anaerocolumna cellulosilytica]BCJ96924.1 thioredoxin-2 [Anaerocolumna cellulosilytica]